MGRTIFQHILEQNGIPKLRERIADIDRHRREKRGKRTKRRGKTDRSHAPSRSQYERTSCASQLLEKIEKERAVSLFLSFFLVVSLSCLITRTVVTRIAGARTRPEQVSMSLYFSGVKFRRLFQGILPPVCTIASLWSSG